MILASLKISRNHFMYLLNRFHVFNWLDNFYAFDIETSATFSIDNDTYTTLMNLLSNNDQNELINSSSSGMAKVSLLLSSINAFPSKKSDDILPFEDKLINHSPRSIMMVITTRCNLTCKYCYEDRIAKRIDMNIETAKRSVDMFISRSDKRRLINVTFFGGEPLLNFKTLQFVVEYCNQRCNELGKSVSYCITTNGTLLDSNKIDFLVDNEFGIMLSIDGPSYIHDKYRKYKTGLGSYAVVSENAKKLIKKQNDKGQLAVVLRSTLSNEFVKSYDDVYCFLKNEFKGARIMVGTSLGKAESKQECDFKPNGVLHEDSELLNKWLMVNQNELTINQSDMPLQLRNMISFFDCSNKYSNLPDICGICRNMMAIDPNGRFYPCHRFVGNNSFIIGNINSGIDESRVKNIYRSYYSKYRENCMKCWARILCGGECSYYLSKENGEFSGYDATRCQSLIKSFERTIGLLASIYKKRRDLIELWA